MADGWMPFRPTAADLARIAGEVGAIPELQHRLVEAHPGVAVRDRVAHQQQVAGSRVRLEIAADLPPEIAGIGLFRAGVAHYGVGRISTGLGCPHAETDPDFLGLMLAFRAAEGKRVDFLAINDPTSPTDDHAAFMALLSATADSAAPFGSGIGALDLAAAQTRLGASLVRQFGLIGGAAVATHVLGQTATTWRSSSAWQPYWTGIVELAGTAGKFHFRPLADANPHRGLQPPERHLTADWHGRQSAGPIAFLVEWLPFLSQRQTPTDRLTQAWAEQPVGIGTLTFPQQDPLGEEAWLWSALAAELGANPGHWVHDLTDSISEPATEFGCARKLAYRLSQEGRAALAEDLYAEIFATGEIGTALAAELRRRRAEKARGGHGDGVPVLDQFPGRSGAAPAIPSST